MDILLQGNPEWLGSGRFSEGSKRRRASVSSQSNVPCRRKSQAPRRGDLLEGRPRNLQQLCWDRFFGSREIARCSSRLSSDAVSTEETSETVDGYYDEGVHGGVRESIQSQLLWKLREMYA